MGLYHIVQMSMTLRGIILEPSGLRAQFATLDKCTCGRERRQLTARLPLYAKVE